MSTIEERIFNKIKERILEFERTKVKAFLPLKKQQTIELYRRLKLEFEGELLAGCKSKPDDIRIRIVCNDILDVAEAGTFLALLKTCDYISIYQRRGKIIIDLQYQLWKWVDK